MNALPNKIKTVEQIREIIGHRPRKKKVAMCHGTFDVVHPGHIRHLMYAKEKCDILVASLTCDEFIAKGDGRPYVPEVLRAINLAALEAVDYVLIDSHADPQENILFLKPDFFVKGFEYSLNGIHPKSMEEISAVDSYGGQFLFSPGDIVYSSTSLLRHHKPKLTIDKLHALLQSEGLSFDELRKTLSGFVGTRVHVVGDLIVDKYAYCSILGPTPKRPTFSVKREFDKVYVGGAGVVALHLKSMGADVVLTTIVGEDEAGVYARERLASEGIRVNAVMELGRPTTQKERFWASGQNLLQVDTVENRPISLRLVEELAKAIEKEASEAVAFCDFRHGIFHGESIAHLAAAIPVGAIRVADSQVSNRWGNITEFSGFDLITPNEVEARFALGDQDSGLRHLARRLHGEAKARYLILKLGEKGTLTYRLSSEQPRSFFHLDSFVETLADPLGAGDALLSAATLALTRTGCIVQSSILGAISAALACEAEGNGPVALSTVRHKLQTLEREA